MRTGASPSTFRTPQAYSAPETAAASFATKCRSPTLPSHYAVLGSPRPTPRGGALEGITEAEETSLCRPLRAGGWVGAFGAGMKNIYIRGLSRTMSLMMQIYTRAHYSSVQVDGIDLLLNQAGHVRFPGGALWLFSHTDEPDDALNVGALLNRLPAAQRGDSCQKVMAAALMRGTKTFFERLVTKWIMGPVMTHMDVDPPVGETPAGERARHARNGERLNVRANAVLARGMHQVIFPQGTVYGDGTIRIKKVRGVVAFSRMGDTPVPVIVGALCYEPLVPGAKPKVLVGLRAPFKVRDGASRAELIDTLQAEMCRASPLTLSGIAGAYLQHKRARSAAPVSLEEAELARVVDGVVEQALKRADWRLDHDLQEPLARRERVRWAFARLQELGYLDARGVLMGKLGPAAEPGQSPTAEEISSKTVHRNDPLRYWGNRVRQQAFYMPDLAAALDVAFAGKRASASAASPRPTQGCVVM